MCTGMVRYVCGQQSKEGPMRKNKSLQNKEPKVAPSISVDLRETMSVDRAMGWPPSGGVLQRALEAVEKMGVSGRA